MQAASSILQSTPPDFRTIHDRYRAPIRARLERLGVADGALDDATQDVFAVMYRGLDRIDHLGAVGAWLHGIARRVAFRHRRASWRHSRKLRELPRDDRGTHDSRRWDALIMLDGGLRQLDPALRTTYELVELEGLSAAEAALRLGVPRTTIHGRLAAARRELGGLLEELGVARSRRTRAWLVPWFGLPALGSPASIVGVGALVMATLLLAPTPELGRDGPSTPPSPIVEVPPSTIARALWVLEPSAALMSVPPTTASPASRPELAPEPAPEPEPPVVPPRRQSRRDYRVTPGEAEASEASPRPSAPSSISPPASPPSAELPAFDSLSAEVELLRRAKRALADGRPAQALTWLDEHAAAFERGALNHAREAARVTALCALGRAPEAQRRAQQLRAQPGGAALVPHGDPCRIDRVETVNPSQPGD